MGIKKALRRRVVKIERKIFGKPKGVMISTGKGGLTKAEIENVLATLGEARKQGKILALSFEYRSPTIIDRREPIFLIPKDGNVLGARVKIRGIIKAKYGAQFSVDGGKASSASKVEVTQSRTRLSSRRMPRITPKTPRLRR